VRADEALIVTPVVIDSAHEAAESQAVHLTELRTAVDQAGWAVDGQDK